MSKQDNLTDFLVDVADAIREKKGTTEKINPQDFSEEIRGIESGGGNPNNATIEYIDPTQYGPDAIKVLTIHEGVTELISNAIYMARNMTHLYLPSTLKIIGDSSVYAAWSLQEIIIPEGVTSIGKSAFSSCRRLKAVRIPDAVINIGADAFRYCYDLALVDIGSSVESIGNLGFANNSIQIAVCRALIPPTIDASSFAGHQFGSIYVPDDSVDAYKSATNWASYADYIKPLSEFVEPTTE